MTSLTRWVLAHKRTVVAFWLVVTIAGIAAAGPAANALSDKFNVPGKEALDRQRQDHRTSSAAPAARTRRSCRWSRSPRARRSTRRA